MRIKSSDISRTMRTGKAPVKKEFDKIKLNVEDKLSRSSVDPEMTKMKDLKQASLKNTGTGEATVKADNSPGGVKSFLMKTGKIMMLGLAVITPFALAGCGSGGGAETSQPPAPIEQQVEQEAEKKVETPQVDQKAETTEKTETGKTGGGSIFDRFLTKEAQEKLKGVAREAGEIVKGPGTIKEKATKVGKKVAHEAQEAAEDFLKEDSQEVIDAAKKAQEKGGDGIKENVSDVIEKGTDYLKKKAGQAKQAYDGSKEAAGEAQKQGEKVLEEGKKAGNQALEFWNELKGEYQKVDPGNK